MEFQKINCDKIKLTKKEQNELQDVISILEDILIFMDRKESKELTICRETVKNTNVSADKICDTQDTLELLLVAKNVYTMTETEEIE